MRRIIPFCNKNNDASLINSSWYKLGLECSKYFTEDTIGEVISRKSVEYLNYRNFLDIINHLDKSDCDYLDLLKKQYQHEDLDSFQYRFLFFWGFDIGILEYEFADKNSCT